MRLIGALPLTSQECRHATHHLRARGTAAAAVNGRTETPANQEALDTTAVPTKASGGEAANACVVSTADASDARSLDDGPTKFTCTYTEDITTLHFPPATLSQQAATAACAHASATSGVAGLVVRGVVVKDTQQPVKMGPGVLVGDEALEVRMAVSTGPGALPTLAQFGDALAKVTADIESIHKEHAETKQQLQAQLGDVRSFIIRTLSADIKNTATQVGLTFLSCPLPGGRTDIDRPKKLFPSTSSWFSGMFRMGGKERQQVTCFLTALHAVGVKASAPLLDKLIRARNGLVHPCDVLELDNKVEGNLEDLAKFPELRTQTSDAELQLAIAVLDCYEAIKRKNPEAFKTESTMP